MRTALVCLLAMLAVAAPLNVVTAGEAVEPWTYTETFEDRALGAWASYPNWQDTAYDQKFRVNEIVPGDPNLSIEQKQYPYSHRDTYVGAQKVLDMYLVPGAEIQLRYYIKYNQPAEFVKVRFAAGDLGKLDVTIDNPDRNRWVWINLDYTDFVRENPRIAGMSQVKVYGMAVLAKIPGADPAMPVFFGLDDVTVSAARHTHFQFATPSMYKLPEFAEYIPKDHYTSGDSFELSGRWPVDAENVHLTISSLTDTTDVVHESDLRNRDDIWTAKTIKLSWPDGLYRGKLEAYRDGKPLSHTYFTVHIAPEDIGGVHPRLLWDAEKQAELREKINTAEYSEYAGRVRDNAARQRENIPVSSLVYDLDQFPEEDWLPTWSAWGSRIYHTDGALRWNALAWALLGDREAGQYAVDVLVKLSTWPDWTHPWQTNRGRFSEHRTGSWSHRVALAYDLTYDLMNADERKQIRDAVMRNLVGGAHRTYVYNDNIAGKTSNWLAMILGGSLTCQSALFMDGEDTANIEPYFTGAALKYWAFINRVTDSPDGAWGEGFGYNRYSFHNMSYSIPTLINVFNVNMSRPLEGTYKEFIWAGPVKDKEYFHYGDSGSGMTSDNWAFLLNITKNPLLSWFYHYMRGEDDLWDLVYDLDIPQEPPFDKEPVKLFRQVGTTVFKSGWETDDFIFVMRTGAFVNHQHLDQGSFWLADRGVQFTEERHGSTYYDDPLYQSNYIQPIGHSTILIDHNPQSQREGDHRSFAPGFNDHAFVSHFLNGTEAAFVTGDIGRLYWDKVDCLRRNVLYLKPRTLLMLDTAAPGKTDVDVTLLYQTAHLDDIDPGGDASSITRDGVTMHIQHLAPAHVTAEAVETPHFLYTLQRENPLEKEGMLTVTARTKGVPLVMANLLTSTTAGNTPSVTHEMQDGCVVGSAEGAQFVFSTAPGNVYEAEGFTTDALALTWSTTSRLFAAQVTDLRRDGMVLLESKQPITAELADTIKYYHCVEDDVAIGVQSRPETVTVNGSDVKNWHWDAEKKAVVVTLPKGEGTVAVK